jgi:hypothetical protein
MLMSSSMMSSSMLMFVDVDVVDDVDVSIDVVDDVDVSIDVIDDVVHVVDVVDVNIVRRSLSSLSPLPTSF